MAGRWIGLVWNNFILWWVLIFRCSLIMLVTMCFSKWERSSLYESCQISFKDWVFYLTCQLIPSALCLYLQGMWYGVLIKIVQTVSTVYLPIFTGKAILMHCHIQSSHVKHASKRFNMWGSDISAFHFSITLPTILKTINITSTSKNLYTKWYDV